MFFRRALQQTNQNQITANGAGPDRHRADGDDRDHGAGGRLVPAADRRRPPLDAELQRPARQDPAHQGQGHDITAADANKADLGTRRRVHDPVREPVPARGRRSRRPRPVPRSTRWASATRSACRWTRTTSPTSPTTRRTPTRRRAAAGRQASAACEIVRKPANYGYPICYSSKLGYYRWNFTEFAPGTTTVGTPLDNPPQPIDCGASPFDQRLALGARRRPGLRARPARAAAGDRSGHLVLLPRQHRRRRRSARRASATTRRPRGRSRRARRPSARGCSRSCSPAASAPHGAVKYHYDPANPSTKKFPPYYDNSVILGEFTQDTMREVKLDSQNRVFKINSFLPCGAGQHPEPDVHVRVRQPDGHAVRQGRLVLPADLR